MLASKKTRVNQIDSIEEVVFVGKDPDGDLNGMLRHIFDHFLKH